MLKTYIINLLILLGFDCCFYLTLIDVRLSDLTPTVVSVRIWMKTLDAAYEGMFKNGYTYPLKGAKSKPSTDGQPTWINKGVVVISVVVA